MYASVTVVVAAFSRPQPPAPRRSSLRSARVLMHSLVHWPSGSHPDPAGPGRAHGQTAWCGIGRAENAETLALPCIHESARARESEQAHCLSVLKYGEHDDGLVQRIMDEFDGMIAAE